MSIKKITREVLKNIEPPKEDLKFINDSVKKFVGDFGKVIKKNKVDAEVFVGGSIAKKTVIKKGLYDADVFIRFDKKYNDEEKSVLMKKFLKNFDNVSEVHGSRDYFRVKMGPYFFIEIIPVRKVGKPEEADNITDLSYSHVKYINRKVKREVLDEIKLAKAFCHAKKCYGAESYIKGFSGYGLELLIYHYGSFVKFLKAMVKHKEGKIIIDLEKDFKNKREILLNLNGSKLFSPIVLIDPTFKQRNVLAALSEETFEKFKKDCVEFLKKPSVEAFEMEKIDFEEMREDAKGDFVLLKIKTEKQMGDVAGSKLLKFYKSFSGEMSRYFDIKKSEFEYEGDAFAKCGFVARSRGEIIFDGPFVKDKGNVKKFKQEHKKVVVKKGRLIAKEKVDFDLKGFVDFWKKKNVRKMKEMYIASLDFI
jgi:tRNA nucleotidyltransferase (CCA-adding enzyme)